MKKLSFRNFGITLIGLGALWAVITFLSLYGLAGKCPPADIVCSNHVKNIWTLKERLGLGVVAIGILVVVFARLKQRREK